MFMNEYEIAIAVQSTQHRPIQNRAARFLEAFKDQVNQHSDGWPYWHVATHAAKRLMELLRRERMQSGEDITEEELRKAISPVKAFYTRRGNAAGMTFPEVGQ